MVNPSSSERTQRALIMAYEAPYVSMPLPSDCAWETDMQAAAARFILAARPAGWYAWVQNKYPDYLTTDTAKHLWGTCRIYEHAYEDARQLLNEAFAFRRQAGDKPRQASTLVNLADIALRQQELLRAWGLLSQALALDPTLPVIHINRIGVARRFGKGAFRGEALQSLYEHLPKWRDDGFVSTYVATRNAHCTSMR